MGITCAAIAIGVFARVGDRVEGVERDEEEVDADILRRSRRLFTIGKTSAMDAKRSKELSVSRGEGGVLVLSGKLL
jgi:hypothetical protein